MEELMWILKEREKALNAMTYLDHKISGIDEKVIKRAYTPKEIEEDDRLEEEKAKIRKKFEDLGEKLQNTLRTPQRAVELIRFLEIKREEDKKKEIKGSGNIELYLSWVKSAKYELEKKTIGKEDDRER